MNPNCTHCQALFKQLMTCVQMQVNPPIVLQIADEIYSKELINELIIKKNRGYWQTLWAAIKGR